MSSARTGSRPTPVSRAWMAWTRWSFESNLRYLVPLLAGSAACTLAIGIWPDVVPLSLVVVPLTVGSLLLGPRELPWFVVATLTMLALDIPRQPVVTLRIGLGIGVVFALGLLILATSYRRSRLGVGGARGEAMFVELRDRIMRESSLPTVPTDWYAEAQLRSAGGTPFAGDFVVADLIEDEQRLEVAVVDVSGKGAQAGVRALQLSGAFGSLIGAVPSDRFLPAANEYLLRQDWAEGFASAVHLTIDLRRGSYAVRCAGHPPAVRFQAGSGRWTQVEVEGPLLGLIDDADFPVARGMLLHGDAMVLYTDGMVETPGRDIDLGIDKLLGQAQRVLRTGFENGGIGYLVDTLGSASDDRALVVVHRR